MTAFRRLWAAVRPAADPHRCMGCDRVMRRLSPAMARHAAAGMEPSCPWCGAPVERAGARLVRDLLVLAANTVTARDDGWDRIQDRITQNGAPGWTPGTPDQHPTAVKEPKAMTIIPRRARDLHAGDVITADPDHDNQPVRWRVTRPPVRTADGEYALADYTDLASGGHGIAYYRVLTELPVEPAGGAA